LLCLSGFQIFDIFVNFSFVIIFISTYYLFKEIFFSNLVHKNSIPIIFRLIMALLLIIIIINIFRSPPSNIKGFIRFLFGKYYVGAWYPLLFFYVGSKLKYWSQILAFATKNLIFLVMGLPFVLLILINYQNFYGTLIFLPLLFPILILNRNLFKKQTNNLITLSLAIYLISTFLIGSRGYTFHVIIYIVLVHYLTILRKNINRTRDLFKLNILYLVFGLFAYFVYNVGISDKFNIEINSNLSKFEKSNFENSRKQYVYPDFFADMNTFEDLIFGRGINGSYYSFIFEGHMENLVDEDNSLGVKPGYRTEIESGYLFTVLKIGILGLVLKLILAFSAVYLGLFKSNNFFVKSCALIVLEWLVFMYPMGLPSYSMGYVLFWLCIGACLSKETRLAKSSFLFSDNYYRIRKINNSFFNISKF